MHHLLGLALLLFLFADALESPMICLVLHAACAREPLAPGGGARSCRRARGSA